MFLIYVQPSDILIYEFNVINTYLYIEITFIIRLGANRIHDPGANSRVTTNYKSTYLIIYRVTIAYLFIALIKQTCRT